MISLSRSAASSIPSFPPEYNSARLGHREHGPGHSVPNDRQFLPGRLRNMGAAPERGRSGRRLIPPDGGRLSRKDETIKYNNLPIAYMITSDYESDLPQQRNMNRLPQIGIINEFPFLAEKKMNIFPKDSAIISSGCGKHANAMPKAVFFW